MNEREIESPLTAAEERRHLLPPRRQILHSVRRPLGEGGSGHSRIVHGRSPIFGPERQPSAAMLLLRPREIFVQCGETVPLRLTVASFPLPERIDVVAADLPRDACAALRRSDGGRAVVEER